MTNQCTRKLFVCLMKTTDPYFKFKSTNKCEPYTLFKGRNIIQPLQLVSIVQQIENTVYLLDREIHHTK